MTKNEDDQKRRRPKTKTTKNKDDQKRRRPKTKMTKNKDDQKKDDQKQRLPKTKTKKKRMKMRIEWRRMRGFTTSTLANAPTCSTPGIYIFDSVTGVLMALHGKAEVGTSSSNVLTNSRSQKCCKSIREEIQDEEEAFDHLRHCHVKFI